MPHSSPALSHRLSIGALGLRPAGLFRTLLTGISAAALVACASAPLEADEAPAVAPSATTAAEPSPPVPVDVAPTVATVVPVPPPPVPVVEVKLAERSPVTAEASTVVPPVSPPQPSLKISSSLTHGYYVNVGAFKVPGNAAHAYRKLQEAGLPVVAQSLHVRKGALTRVGAGPFPSRAAAKAAATKIAQLQLEALVVKH